MATRTRKSQELSTVEAGLDMVLDQPVEKTLDEAAEYLDVAVFRLQELFCDRLNSTEPMSWLTVPTEHNATLEDIKRQMDAENSVRRFDNPTESTVQLPPVEELPVLPEESQPKQRGGRLKKQSTDLTKHKSSKLKESDQKAQQLAASDQQVKVALHARKGQKSGAQLATIELAAEDATYRQIKGQALVRKVGQLTSEIASESEFDPIQVLAELGIDSNSEIFEDLRQQVEPALGKLESATAEIVENAWVNGIDLGVELGNLQNLLNSNNCTSDYWQ